MLFFQRYAMCRSIAWRVINLEISWHSLFEVLIRVGLRACIHKSVCACICVCQHLGLYNVLKKKNVVMQFCMCFQNFNLRELNRKCWGKHLHSKVIWIDGSRLIDG